MYAFFHESLHFKRKLRQHYKKGDKNHKLPLLQCYHTFSNSRDIYLLKNHYEPYSPQIVLMAKIWGSGSRPINDYSVYFIFYCDYAGVLKVKEVDLFCRLG